MDQVNSGIQSFVLVTVLTLQSVMTPLMPICFSTKKNACVNVSLQSRLVNPIKFLIKNYAVASVFRNNVTLTFIGA